MNEKRKYLYMLNLFFLLFRAALPQLEGFQTSSFIICVLFSLSLLLVMFTYIHIAARDLFRARRRRKKFNSTSPGNKSVSSSSVWENILLWKFLCGYFPPEEASRMIRKGDLDGKSHRGASAKAPGLQRNFRLVILA